MKMTRLWAVEVEGKYIAVVGRDEGSNVRGTLRVMHGATQVGERSVIVNAGGPFGPQNADVAEWSRLIEEIVTDHAQIDMLRNK